MTNDNRVAMYYAGRARRYSLIAALGLTAVVVLGYLAGIAPVFLTVFGVAAGAAWFSFARQAMLIRVLRRLAG